MSSSTPNTPKNKASTSNEQGDAGLQQTGDVAASTTTATRSSTRQSTAAPVAEQRPLRSSTATLTLREILENSSSSSGSTTTKNDRRVTFSSIVNPPKKKAEKSKSSKEEEEEMPSTSRAIRPQTIATTSFTKDLLDHVKKLSHDVEERLKRSASADGDSKGAKKRRRGETSHSLEETLAETILVKPYFIDVNQGQDGASSDKSKEASTEPVKVLKSEDLPGITIWNAESYVDAGYSTDKKNIKVGMFMDREVERVVAYVLHKPNPFVLVKLAQKRNEKTVRVKDVVQAVDCGLAATLFINVLTAFMTRMASGSMQKTGEETENPTDEETEEGPSGSGSSMTPSGRSRRGTKN